jgi:excinuclease UvrABC nuclease subunit
MEAIRIKAYTKTRKQMKSIEDFLTKEGIEFEVIDKEDVLEFFNELESSLGQVKEIQEGKLRKEKASDFLNEL